MKSLIFILGFILGMAGGGENWTLNLIKIRKRKKIGIVIYF